MCYNYLDGQETFEQKQEQKLIPAVFQAQAQHIEELEQEEKVEQPAQTDQEAHPQP